MLTIFIPGKVSGKGRPKFRRRGNFVQTYTPAKTANAEGIIRTMVALELGSKAPSAAPVRLELYVNIAPPQSWPDWKRKAAIVRQIAATTKPDLDNVTKLVKDALNKVVWQDDAQVVECDASKTYAEQEGLLITVYECRSMSAQNATRNDIAQAI